MPVPLMKVRFAPENPPPEIPLPLKRIPFFSGFTYTGADVLGKTITELVFGFEPTTTTLLLGL